MRKLNFIFLSVFITVSSSSSFAHIRTKKEISQKTLSRPTQAFHVVIDPGHGGIDEGAVYKRGLFRVTEKQVTLKLAQQIAGLLRKRGIRTTLTRTQDQELSLASRTALANRLKANIFISIHTNSSENLDDSQKASAAEGVETFILNTTSDASSKRLAKIENSVIHTEDLTPDNLDVVRILKDLRLDANLTPSKRLACLVQSKLSQATQSRFKKNSKRNRGVKQALFHVLLGADMPSILVEVGFLNHAYDRSLMISNPGQLKIALSITQSIEDFQRLSGFFQFDSHPSLNAKKSNEFKIKNKNLLSECKMN